MMEVLVRLPGIKIYSNYTSFSKLFNIKMLWSSGLYFHIFEVLQTL